MTGEARAVHGNIVYCGECSEVMVREIPDELIDLTVTSPPYDNLRDYNGYTFDFEAIATQLWRVTKQGGVVVWVVADQTKNGSESGTSFRQALGFMELGFNLHDTMIYENDKPPRNDPRYAACFEYMFILSRGMPKSTNLLQDKRKDRKSRGETRTFRYPDGTLRDKFKESGKTPTVKKRNIWYFPVNNMWRDKDAVAHPARFPESLARDHIISWSNPGDIVLDPMCGSGTTLKMAKELDRQYVGIDISQEYCELSQRRVRGARVALPGFSEAMQDDANKPEQAELFAPDNGKGAR